MHGRVRFMAIIYASIVISGIVYPAAAHWVWSVEGWLNLFSTYGPIDCSGGGPVHLLGGVFGLMGCVIIGPRIEFRGIATRDERWFNASNKVLAASGAFFLWMGWLAFVSVSSASTYPTAQVGTAGRVMVVTILAGASGAVSVFMHRRLLGKDYDLVWVANGLIAGCAAITAPAAVVEVSGAASCGGVCVAR